ncbi:unnamed protein product [Brassica napus]|uniref:(rape) hypothetical protein n=1 Tax=Brassica napus TaxID=3708 RepID=A0A816IQG0_BRANA|nr:unnamed protein product [Brassica napus]
MHLHSLPKDASATIKRIFQLLCQRYSFGCSTLMPKISSSLFKRRFNVTIITSANTQDEILPQWSGFLQKDEGETQ